MTFDRLDVNPKADDLACLAALGTRSFRVVAVPATISWHPYMERERALVTGWEDAIRANPLIPPLRKEFLIDRRGYWNEWARKDTKSLISMGDAE